MDSNSSYILTLANFIKTYIHTDVLPESILGVRGPVAVGSDAGPLGHLTVLVVIARAPCK